MANIAGILPIDRKTPVKREISSDPVKTAKNVY